MTLERTWDLALIRRIATHERIYRHIADDGSPPPGEWQPPDPNTCAYLAVRDGEEVLGMFILVPQNCVCIEFHTCMLPQAWGPHAMEAALMMVEWVWANTPAQRLVSNVPEYNRLAYKFGFRMGLREWGRNPKSYRKDGVLQDQIWLGISRNNH